MRLPTYDEIARVPEQLDIWDAPFDESLFVAGPLGSGKTVLAVHRARMMAASGMQTVLVTYNRMLRRLIAFVDGKQGTGIHDALVCGPAALQEEDRSAKGTGGSAERL